MKSKPSPAFLQSIVAAIRASGCNVARVIVEFDPPRVIIETSAAAAESASGFDSVSFADDRA